MSVLDICYCPPPCLFLFVFVVGLFSLLLCFGLLFQFLTLNACVRRTAAALAPIIPRPATSLKVAQPLPFLSGHSRHSYAFISELISVINMSRYVHVQHTCTFTQLKAFHQHTLTYSCCCGCAGSGTKVLSIWERLAQCKQPVTEPRESQHCALAIADFKAKVRDKRYPVRASHLYSCACACVCACHVRFIVFSCIHVCL